MSWPLAAGLSAVAAAAGGSLYYACSVPASQMLGPTLVRGPADRPRIALTFDDGPARPSTEQILDTLRREQVPAAFFVCGKNVERYPEVVRRIQAEGHTLGNHTYSHPLLYLKGRARIAAEIDRTQAAIEHAVGERPRLFRPPYGVRWFGLFPLLRERGLSVVQWSDTGFDWKENGPAEIARLALRNLKSGSVILLHDGREPREPQEVDACATVEALPMIIEGARKAGLEWVSVKEFLH
ncbi:MAG TPA: polysaccharide deacetylase family protein [Terriglobia bacterium]|nr:polysaccharide deacetylase family protein [Terriglobia bacterium]